MDYSQNLTKIAKLRDQIDQAINEIAELKQAVIEDISKQEQFFKAALNGLKQNLKDIKRA
jgi:cell division protein FtsL